MGRYRHEAYWAVSHTTQPFTLLVLKTIISSLEKGGARLNRAVYEAIEGV